MKKGIFLLLYIVVLLLLIEAACRLFMSPVYIGIEDLKNFRKPVNLGENRAGIKIAMLGDSFTYGSKVNDEETSSFYLAEILRERLGREDIYVENFGISGTSTVEQYYIFERYIKSSDYDFVVLNFFIDDFTPYYYNNSVLNPYIFCREYEEGAERLLYYLNRLRFVEMSIVYTDLFITYMHAGVSLTPVSYMIQKMMEKDSLRYRCARELLIKMGKEIIQSNKKGIFVLIPSLTLYDFQNPYPEEIAGYETMAMLTAKRSGFEIIDTLTELRDVLDQRLIIQNDIHYNARGYELIAKLIADRILEMMKKQI